MPCRCRTVHSLQPCCEQHSLKHIRVNTCLYVCTRTRPISATWKGLLTLSFHPVREPVLNLSGNFSAVHHTSPYQLISTQAGSRMPPRSVESVRSKVCLSHQVTKIFSYSTWTKVFREVFLLPEEAGLCPLQRPQSPSLSPRQDVRV